MKKAFIIGLIAVSATTGLTSCLDTDSGRFVEAGGEMTAQDSAFRLMSVLDGIKALAPRLVLLGELRGDLMQTTQYANREERQINDWTLNENLENKYLSQREYYRIINECNYIIKYGNALPKEQAVAVSIRAWTYLQLVLNYGKAEYYTEPILSDADADKQYTEYDINGLADILIPQLEAVKDVPRPEYGALSGYVLSYEYINPDFLLGDLYLWRGQGDDYEKAAAQYMRLIRRDKFDPDFPAYSASPCPFDDVNSFSLTTAWMRYVYPLSTFDVWTGGAPRRDNGNLTLSDQTIGGEWSRIGETMTDVVYFNNIGAVQSNLDTLSGLESSIVYSLQPQEAKEKIAITASPVLGALFGSVPYAYLERESEYVTNPFQSWLMPPTGMRATKGDLRINGTFSRSPGVSSGRSTGVGINPEYPDSVIAKYLDYGGFQNKIVSIYRVGSLYLRYAEAVNRAGKPSLAMIVLKYGLSPDNVRYYMAASEKPATNEYHVNFLQPNGVQIPSLNTTTTRNLYAEDAETKIGTTENGFVVIDEEDAAFVDPFLSAQNSAYYVLPITTVLYGDNAEPRLTVNTNATTINPTDTLAVLFRAGVEGYYDIPRTMYANVGLHWRGAGCAAADTTYKMPNVLYPGNVAAQQQYMEKLIADEYALETAFEGGRFYDLMRISKHQQNPEFLVERVAKKYGARYQEFYDKLLVGRNGWYATSWYLPRQRQE